MPVPRPAAPFVLALLMLTGLAACAPRTPPAGPPPTGRTSAPTPSPAGTPAAATGTAAPGPDPVTPTTPLDATAPGTAVLLTIGDTTVAGELWDNPAARELASRLPLTLTFSDYGGVEKTAGLAPPLSMDGMPAGDDPDPGEIGWYAPDSVLVLYHGDVGAWDGIARLGTVDDSAIRLLADGPRDVTVTIEPAG